MASSSGSKRASKYSPGEAGARDAGTVSRRLESSVTIMVGLSHCQIVVVNLVQKRHCHKQDFMRRTPEHMFPWKEPKEWIPLAVRQIHPFLRAHRPASA